MNNTITAMLNILLVEDHTFLRQKLAEFLRDKAFGVLEAEDAATALHLARAHPVDGVTVDIVLPPLHNQPATYHHSEGLNLVRALRQEKSTLPVLIQSSHPDRSRHFFDWLAEGQMGLGSILKHGSPDRLIHALHKVLQGQCYWDDQVQDRLAVVAELLDWLSPEANESLTEIHEAIQTLYQIRNTLNLSELRNGLALPVRQLAQRYAARWKLAIETDIEEAALSHLPPQQAGAIYRVIHQALDNVAAHARATQVHLRLWAEADRVWLEVRDNGRGSSPAERAQAEANGHMGLQGMKTRLEGLGGEFQLISQPGAGTLVRGWVPAVTAPA